MYSLCIIGPAIFDYKKRLILLSVTPLSGGHCLSWKLPENISFLPLLSVPPNWIYQIIVPQTQKGWETLSYNKPQKLLCTLVFCTTYQGKEPIYDRTRGHFIACGNRAIKLSQRDNTFFLMQIEIFFANFEGFYDSTRMTFLASDQEAIL